MATGTEMLIQTLVKALKLEPQIEQVRAALENGLLERFKSLLDKAEAVDDRLARIEAALGIKPDAARTIVAVEPGSDTGDFDGGIEPARYDPVQSSNGVDNFGA